MPIPNDNISNIHCYIAISETKCDGLIRDHMASDKSNVSPWAISKILSKR